MHICKKSKYFFSITNNTIEIQLTLKGKHRLSKRNNICTWVLKKTCKFPKTCKKMQEYSLLLIYIKSVNSPKILERKWNHKRDNTSLQKGALVYGCFI